MIAVKVVAAVIYSEMPLERYLLSFFTNHSRYLGPTLTLIVKVDILLFLSNKGNHV